MADTPGSGDLGDSGDSVGPGGSGGPATSGDPGGSGRPSGSGSPSGLSSRPARAALVVGVFPGQPDPVLAQAAQFAARFDAVLVCAFIDQTRYVVSRNADGTVISAPMDPDIPDDLKLDFPPELADHLASILDPLGVRWSTLRSAGDPADSLGSLAEALDAVAIVVGTHRSTARSSIAEFFNGSVAVHLAHRQHRPVIVVPVAPVERGQALPWPSS
ncbi:MAG: hypothetical protein JWQ64_769 [Subtercola sp.]|nr:hypothetical protein [Subtercola sp.]